MNDPAYEGLSLNYETDELKEGGEAMREKRDPDFRGQR